jgi:beta-glucosidase
VGSITRPVKELKGFTKTYLEPGESKTISFILNNNMLSFYNYDLTWGSEPGKFTVFVGGSSKDNLSTDFELLE